MESSGIKIKIKFSNNNYILDVPRRLNYIDLIKKLESLLKTKLSQYFIYLKNYLLTDNGYCIEFESQDIISIIPKSVGDDYHPEDFEGLSYLDYDTILSGEVIERKENYEGGKIHNEYKPLKKDMIINVKFLKLAKENPDSIAKKDLSNLLKLSLLKEIALEMRQSELEKISNPNVKDIITILKNGLKEFENNIKPNIIKVLEYLSGSNIYIFAKYVNNEVPNESIPILKSRISNEPFIEYTHAALTRYIGYNSLFEQTFEEAKRTSVFEYSIVSLAIIERNDVKKYEDTKKDCKNCIERVLFHGSPKLNLAHIFIDEFHQGGCRQMGRGIYFTDSLDYVSYYGGKNNRDNLRKIPEVGSAFTFLASSVFFDETKVERITELDINKIRDPEIFEMNLGIAEANTKTCPEKFKLVHQYKYSQEIKDRFMGTEYVFNKGNETQLQILPFYSIQAKRVEYGIVWRDINFSPNPVYGKEMDQLFKDFLKERKKYITSLAKYNVYTFDNSEDALEIIRRKKFGKIILISNVGTDYGGRTFIENARKILGNDVIVLFLAYDIGHLDWIKKFKNAIFSNEPKFYEKYIESFIDGDVEQTKNNLKALVKEAEKYYETKLNFDKNFLKYPLCKEGGYFMDVKF